MAGYTGYESYTDDELWQQVAEKQEALPPEVKELIFRLEGVKQPGFQASLETPQLL